MAAVMIRGVGLIGSLVAEKLINRGHSVIVVSRTPGRFAERPGQTVIAREDVEAQRSALEKCQAVINLEGKNIAAGVWTRRLKKEILQSRLYSVAHLSNILRRVDNPQLRVLQASATGYYGNRGEEILTEDSDPGTGFLADTCVEWETAALRSYKKDHFAILRIAPVLSNKAGVFLVWRRIFRSFLGGRLGKGTQYVSWIHEHDMAELLVHYALNFRPGIVNATAPGPVTNAQLTEILAASLHRPALFTVPQFVLSALPGDFGKEMLLYSVRAVPKRALADGFEFRFAGFEEAVSDLS
ncbi:MAG: TIGR01777 family oxidoreductase [Spirochaetota bacterium]